MTIKPQGTDIYRFALPYATSQVNHFSMVYRVFVSAKVIAETAGDPASPMNVSAQLAPSAGAATFLSQSRRRLAEPMANVHPAHTAVQSKAFSPAPQQSKRSWCRLTSRKNSRNGKATKASSISAIWPSSSKRYTHMFPAVQHQLPQQPTNMAPPGPPPVAHSVQEGEQHFVYIPYYHGRQYATKRTTTYPPPANGAGPRPSMPPTRSPMHVHPYYHQSS
ncbi:hypothetical protein BKA83DRAFT_2465014 [Pisolithus microcarpus]|nr:hypothetical protein BKA83DRAFT_2465014 [Pisolithus microcarpus]